MTDDLIKRLWESDAASALTNEAARCIEAARDIADEEMTYWEPAEGGNE